MTERKWYPSELNFIPEVVNQMNLPVKVTPFDSTLREGEETPGVVMTIEDKVTIAKALEELVVCELEIGGVDIFKNMLKQPRPANGGGVLSCLMRKEDRLGLLDGLAAVKLQKRLRTMDGHSFWITSQQIKGGTNGRQIAKYD